ncbi:MFS general substrate transporter [Mycena galopus ATCC 62051]|nr:MFS general substrate transporter [Mycena galopus ATCC 62051]
MFQDLIPRLFIEPAGEEKDVTTDYKAEETVSLVQDDADDFPDGGLRAWIVLWGAVAGFFATSGYVNSWGVFQAYYKQGILHHSTASEIAWIGSIQVRPMLVAAYFDQTHSKHGMTTIPALLAGRLFDIGYYRIPFAVGSILIVLTTFLVPLCNVYWHFLLCQGFGVGIGSGLMFCTMLTIVTHWFKKRRGFALGLACLGTGLGGTVQPVILRQLISRLGFPWAMRTQGFILFFVLSITNLCMARRLKPVKAPGGLLGIRAFRSSAFSVLAVCAFLSFLGLNTMQIYLTSSAIAFGISTNFAFYLAAVGNFSSGVGRLTSGLLGDRFGAMNILTIMTAIAGVGTLAWPFCRTVSSITGISVLVGFSAGAWPALIGCVVGQMGGMEDIGRRMGVIHTLSGIGTLCGPPIFGLFVDSRLGYIAVGYFSGSVLLVSAALIFVSRLLAAPELRRKF